jgi:hypothetical protein
MAKGHRALGPQWVYLPDDPDVTIDLEKYRESNYKEGVEVRPGATKFQIKPLTPRQKRTVLAHDFDSEIVVRCGLVKVEGFVLEDDLGELVAFDQPDRKDRHGDMGASASQNWIDECPIHVPDKNALAAMIWHISEPDPLSCKPLEQQSGGGSKSETESTD